MTETATAKGYTREPYKFERCQMYKGENGHKYLTIAVGRGSKLLVVRVQDLTEQFSQSVMENREYDMDFAEFMDEAVTNDDFTNGIYASEKITYDELTEDEKDALEMALKTYF